MNMLHYVFEAISTFLLSAGMVVSGWFGAEIAPNPTLGVTIPSGPALFETSLQDRISASDTSMTLVANALRDGTALSGYQCFTIDEGRSDREDVCGTISGTAVSSLERGLSPYTATSTVASLKFAHRKGANVKITDFPLIQRMRNLANGAEGYPNILRYASHPTFSSTTDIVDKKYVDDTAFSGAGVVDANTTSRGVVEIATQTEAASSTANGGAGKLVLPADIATSSPASATAALRIPVSQNNGTLSRSWFDANSLIVYGTDSVGSDSYAISPTTPITSYATGLTVVFKAGTANTGAATLNVSSLGAKTIKKNVSDDLATGDILSGQTVTVVYDGTNFQLVSRASQPLVFRGGRTTRAGDAASGSQTIAHGLGVTPKRVRVSVVYAPAGSAIATSEATWDATNTTQAIFTRLSGTTPDAGNATALTLYSNSGGSNSQTATISADATNITLTWTKSGSPDSASMNILWEAEG